jgi:FkbM family methyltransferase
MFSNLSRELQQMYSTSPSGPRNWTPPEAYMSRLKALIKSLSRACGYEIADARFSENAQSLTFRLIALSKATTILDVGANVGQFASGVLAGAPGAKIYSFEPGANAHAEALRRSRRFPNWAVRERVAVGADAGELTLNIAGNSVSSSLLDMASLHEHAAPTSKYQESERVQCRTLDSLLADEAAGDARYYLKIDTQGYEMNVLLGATRTLQSVVAIQCEVSFEELYIDQPLANEIIDFLAARKFFIFAYANGLRDPRSHKLLQADLYFIRSADR